MTEITEEEFLKNYSLKDYPAVGLTVDLCVFTIKNGKLSILLIERGGHPFKGKWALPGGFVNTNETLDDAARRELIEETAVDAQGYLEQLHTYGAPGRDPRGFIVSTAYVALIPKMSKPVAGDDAAQAHFFPVEDIDDIELAFDHRNIIEDGLERVRAKIEYAPVAHHFIDDDSFTMTELRNIYEIVWGETLIPSNFRRKALSANGFLEPVNKKRSSNVEGGRSAELYKAGNAEIIFPPFRR